MKRRKAIVALLLLLVPLAACQLILGIGDDNFTYPTDAPEAGVDSSSEATDPCVHFGLPSQPAVPDGPDLPPLLFAFRSVNVTGRADGGAIVGFDLDNVCTCDSRDGAARGGLKSCLPAAKDPFLGPDNCDEDGGIDNAMVRIFDQLLAAEDAGLTEAKNISGAFNSQIECGHQNLIFVLAGYNGLADDPQVALYPLESKGIRESHFDGGPEEFDGGPCDVNELDAGEGGLPAYPAAFDGKDRWSVSTVAKPPDPNGLPGAVLASGYVKDWHLVVDERDQPMKGFPLVFGAKVIFANGSAMMARLVPVDGPGSKNEIVVPPGGKASAFKLTEGLMGGRLSVRDLLDGAGRITLGPTFLCDDPILYPILTDYLCRASDSVSAAREFTGARCDSVSIAVQFEAVMATYGPAVDRIFVTMPCEASPSCPP